MDVLDTRLLDSTASSASRPAGLLNGVTPITAVSGGGIAALAADLGALAAAIPNPADLVYLMNPGDRIRALTLAPGLLGVTIIEAPGLTAKTVIAIDAADFVSGETTEPRFDVSNTATINADTAPVAIGTPPNVVAAPTYSAFQQDLIVIRALWFLTWAMRRAGRVAYTASVTW